MEKWKIQKYWNKKSLLTKFRSKNGIAFLFFYQTLLLSKGRVRLYEATSIYLPDIEVNFHEPVNHNQNVTAKQPKTQSHVCESLQVPEMFWNG